jgi:23S rRNA pseudouridine1911/1915/1917 synthase
LFKSENAPLLSGRFPCLCEFHSQLRFRVFRVFRSYDFPGLEKLFAILHEDADLLVINKPAGLVCHPTKGDEFSSLISRARLYLNGAPAHVGAKSNEARSGPAPAAAQPLGAPKPGVGGSTILSPHLVNRLDRETSGVVIVAKNAEAAGELGKIWEARAVQKEYLAIVHGHVRDDHGLIDAPLGRDEHSHVAVKDCVRPDGAPAQTEFWVESRFVRDGRAGSPLPAIAAKEHGAHGLSRRSLAKAEVSRPTEAPLSPILHLPFSLLRVIPRTGRKHQIRIHLAHLGHPIVGDKLYGGDEDLYLALVENRLTPEQLARLILPNQALHARAVRFVWRDRPMEFCCNPEPWFTNFSGADFANSRGPK